MPGTDSLYAFSTLKKPIVLRDCDELVPVIRAIMPDWGIKPYQGPPPDNPDILLRKSPKGFVRESVWLENKKHVFKHPVAAVCDLIVDLVHAYNLERPNLICLHSAAVEINDKLVLFPSTYRAGKSTLTAKLVSVGARAFTDDVLPIDKQSGEGISLGIPPRLRLPIPDSSDADFRAFVANQKGPGSDRYLYLDHCERQARLGDRKAIEGIVVLRRDDQTLPGIELANKGEMLRDVILRNFVRQGPALEILDLLQRIVEENDCYILRYSTLQQATDLLLDTFGSTIAAGRDKQLSA